MSQKTITIVSVTGHQSYAETSVYAIARSYQELQKSLPQENLKCLLVSPEKPSNCPDYVRHVPCQPFSYFEYNFFMLFSLGQLIDTDFALVVQNDGWVIDGSCWRDEFFEYDFIGAHYPSCVEVKDGKLIRHIQDPEFWFEHYEQLPPNIFDHQNGGFSLRSRKLLNAPRELGLSVDVKAPEPIQPPKAKLEWKAIDHFEDVYLTALKRTELEAYGLKFAPWQVATKFSIDYAKLHQRFGLDAYNTLGTHSSNDIVLIGMNDIQFSTPISLQFLAPTQFANNPILKKYRDLGYKMTLKKELVPLWEKIKNGK